MSRKKKLLVLGTGVALSIVLLVGHYLRERHRLRHFEYELTNLHNPDPQVRSNAVQILRYAGQDKLRIVVPALIPLLRDDETFHGSVATPGDEAT